MTFFKILQFFLEKSSDQWEYNIIAIIEQKNWKFNSTSNRASSKNFRKTVYFIQIFLLIMNDSETKFFFCYSVL